MKWFQPNSSLLLPWLRRIYTPHLCLMRWAFAVKEIAGYIGPYMVRKRSRAIWPRFIFSFGKSF